MGSNPTPSVVVPYKDKTKQRQAQLESYHRRAAAGRTQRAKRQNREALLDFVRKSKERPCVDCKHSFHHAAMDYDHVRGEKVSNIGDMAQEAYSLVVIQEEIAKCDLVCSNCHRLRTWKRHHPDDDILV